MTGKKKISKIGGGIEKYHPICIKIPNVNEDILDSEVSIKFSSNIDYPRFEYGFHHFIHANKNKMELTKQFEGKKKVYLVINPFERYIDEYNESIGNETLTYFDLKDKPNILSRGFYKLWEILMMLDIIDTTQENFVSAHLAEGPGSFIQATMFYRDKMCKKGVSKNDKYHAITLHPDNSSHIPELEKKFVDYYGKEKPQRFILHKTYSKQIAGGNSNKDDGDITNPKTIKLFGGQMPDKADLITADGGFDWENENIQEQESFRLILGQIVTASQIQKKGGTFVCKFFETFTQTALKYILILKSLYKDVYFIKPLTSRPSNSEKYAICMNFKYDNKDKNYKTIIKKLNDLLIQAHENKDKHIVDIFDSFNIPQEFKCYMIELNKSISNHQLQSINKIAKFIEEQNFHGDVYESGRNAQIEASKFWIDVFFPESSKFKESRQRASDILQNELNKHNKNADDLYKILN